MNIVDYGSESEISVLGSIMLDNDALARTEGIITPESFGDPRRRLVFAAMVAVKAAGEPIDPVSLAVHLEKTGGLVDAGGMDHILDLSSASASAVNVDFHAGQVREAANVRAIAATHEAALKRIREGDFESDAQLQEQSITALREVHATVHGGPVRLKVALHAAIDSIRETFTSGRRPGIGTGFAAVDALTLGFRPSNLIIIAARPAMGKTALVTNMALNVARDSGQTVVMFSLEMAQGEVMQRVISSEALVNGERMYSGALSDGDIDRMLQAVKQIGDLPLFIDDCPAISLPKVRAACRLVDSDPTCPPLGLVVVDYLQLMGGSGKKGQSREQEISEISRGLKVLAKELNVPVIALSQLNRSVESRPDKRPMLSDLRESGAIEQDADLVMFVYRDEYYNPDSEDAGLAEIITAKNRHGGTGTRKLKFNKHITRFDDIEPGFGGRA